MKLLLKRLKDPKGQTQIITSGWELIVRESTGAAPRLNAHVDRHVLEVVGGENELT